MGQKTQEDHMNRNFGFGIWDCGFGMVSIWDLAYRSLGEFGFGIAELEKEGLLEG
jgi:hypothetical protein